MVVNSRLKLYILELMSRIKIWGIMERRGVFM